MFRLALHWQILVAMILGAVGGLLLSVFAGERESDGPGWRIRDSADRSEIIIYRRDDQGRPSETVAKRIVVDATLDGDQLAQLRREGAIHFRALVELERAPEHVDAVRLFQEKGRSWARVSGDGAQTIGNLFLRLLRMVSIPLIITSLITGVTGMGQAERLGKMFGRTMFYYLCTSMLAIVTGLAMVNLIRPGLQAGGAAQPFAAQDARLEDGQDKSLGSVLFGQLENMIPPNPIAAAAEGNFLSIIAFSLLIGIFTILVGGKAAERIGALAQAGFQVMMAMTMAIIRLAPIGVLFLMLSATSSQGIAIFGSLGLYMLAVACALVFHAFVTLPLIVHFAARRGPLQFAQAMSPALLTAFSSASSNGTLPLTLTCVEQRAGVSNKVSSFVLPLGATINMDGTALYEVVAVLFIAQFTGYDLTLTQQIIVAFTALLVSIGAAGIPHAGLVMMVIILQAVGLPTETQGLIIAVDRVLDMCRTCVNVWSDSCGCAVIARFEEGPASESQMRSGV